MVTIVSTSTALCTVMSHATRYYNRPGISYLPLADSHRLRWALVWRSEAETPQIRALARVVSDLGRLDLDRIGGTRAALVR
jgi:hypothetical protein